MSQKEIKKLDIINRLIRQDIKGHQAASLLDLSTRQVRRLKTKVKKVGAKGLIHGNRGRVSNHKIPDKERNIIANLLHKFYYDFKPTFASEKLVENHNIHHDPKTIRTIMIEEKLWQPKSKREKEKHRAWRERRSSIGEMEQFDGSYEHWFEERGPECCLLAAIDDATGIITKAQFSEHEGVFPVFQFWREYLLKNGKPLTIYSDKFSTYKMSQRVALENHDLKTQFQRVLEQLQIEPIFANSPQAKGRVERLFNTLQDRLIKELRLTKINNIKQANEFLEKIFIPKFNKRFQVKPRNRVNLHRPLTKKEQEQIDSIFSRQTLRMVQNDFTISFNNRWYQLPEGQPVTICKKDQVVVEEHLTGEIKIRFKGKYLNFQLLPPYAKERRKKQKMPWVLAATPVNSNNPKSLAVINKLKAEVGHF